MTSEGFKRFVSLALALEALSYTEWMGVLGGIASATWLKTEKDNGRPICMHACVFGMDRKTLVRRVPLLIPVPIYTFSMTEESLYLYLYRFLTFDCLLQGVYRY